MPSPHPAFDAGDALGGIASFKHRATGLDVLVMEQPGSPVATFMVTYRVGSRNEGPGLTGATHFLEHLMFKGTERFNPASGSSVFNVLQSLGAQVNATTWLDRTNYFAVLPAEHLERAVEVEFDRMRGALLTDEAVASEKTVILNELDRGENDPFRRLYHLVWATAFLAHPYGHPTIGWRSDVEAVTAAGLRGFYDAFYWPTNATATVIGGVSTAAALDLVDRHVAAVGIAVSDVPEVVTREPEQQGERRVVLRHPAQLSTLVLGWKAPEATHPDADALAVLAALLGSGKSSRLHRALVDTARATFASSSASRLRDPGLFVVYAQPAPGVEIDEIEQTIRSEVRRVAEDGVSEAELDRVRGMVKASEAYARDGAYAAASALNEAIAAGDWRLFVTARARLDAVTPADVQRVAAAYLTDDRLTVGHHLPS